MMGFRFSLVLDFGVGTAARTRHGGRRRQDFAQRMEGARRAVGSRPIPPLPEDLGWGPLEPEDFRQEFGASALRSTRDHSRLALRSKGFRDEEDGKEA